MSIGRRDEGEITFGGACFGKNSYRNKLIRFVTRTSEPNRIEPLCSDRKCLLLDLTDPKLSLDIIGCWLFSTDSRTESYRKTGCYNNTIDIPGANII